MRIHSGDRPFTCQKCDYRAAQKISIMPHMIVHAKIHSGDRPFTCEKCDYRAAQKISKEIFSFIIHTGNRLFTCDVEGCDYRAAHKHHLTQHRRKHTGERPSVLTQRTRMSSSEYFYNAIHSGDRPFTCRKCDYRAAQTISITRHMRVHALRITDTIDMSS
uniref:C2H2-type domain-containing protein n=1 Tax=Branchiostoma floridae TaxID=7739 RepID=C3YGS6_BRAFL|eukprot:XP_002604575.1 hypothetical protein BRAFLDRAFT_220498 [Branchiostoma floridae]